MKAIERSRKVHDNLEQTLYFILALYLWLPLALSIVYADIGSGKTAHLLLPYGFSLLHACYGKINKFWCTLIAW